MDGGAGRLILPINWIEVAGQTHPSIIAISLSVRDTFHAQLHAQQVALLRVPRST